ncbi:hypothetical protein ACFHW2_07490 [Actinomadura sp. LOL_016]|uniref:hypothetical protein n=1 Tax=unclassified Actinomadura TaxID=2626254 RepID=UPI003A801DFC
MSVSVRRWCIGISVAAVLVIAAGVGILRAQESTPPSLGGTIEVSRSPAGSGGGGTPGGRDASGPPSAPASGPPASGAPAPGATGPGASPVPTGTQGGRAVSPPPVGNGDDDDDDGRYGDDDGDDG